MCEQLGVSAGDVDVVVLDGHRRQNCLDIPLPRLPAATGGQLDAHEKLRCGDGSHGDIVLVVDQVIENLAPTFGSYQNRRVQDQAFQLRSSTATMALSSRNSVSQSGSRLYPRRISLIDSPDALTAGPMRATGRPFLTMTKLSPRCSTASRMSEKRRAASVALISTSVRLSDFGSLRTEKAIRATLALRAWSDGHRFQPF
jgi:hypothetical protein